MTLGIIIKRHKNEVASFSHSTAFGIKNLTLSSVTSTSISSPGRESTATLRASACRQEINFHSGSSVQVF